MEKREGHPITLVPQAHPRSRRAWFELMELQEQGYSYVKP